MNNPSIVFRMGGQPPRKTHQGGQQIRRDDDAPGGVRVFQDAEHRMEAAEIRGEFERQLPIGWEPRDDAAEVEVALVYPQRQTDRLTDDALIPHTERPDADNLVKTILDSATRAGVWTDDARVFDLRVRKFRGPRARGSVAVKWGGYGFWQGVRMAVGEVKRHLKEARDAARRLLKKRGDEDGEELFDVEEWR